MEKFMLIFHGGISPEASPQDMQANMGKWMAWVEKLHKDGKYIGGDRLLPGGKFVTSQTTATDGPYTEGKEIVGGYFVVEASSMEEAVAECQHHYPDFDNGGQVQVRHIMKM